MVHNMNIFGFCISDIITRHHGHSKNHHIDGAVLDESLASLSMLIWKHSGSPVSLHFSPSTSLATPGAHVKMRAIPGKMLILESEFKLVKLTMSIKPRTDKLSRQRFNLPNKGDRIRCHRNNPRPSLIQTLTVHQGLRMIARKDLRKAVQCVLHDFRIVLCVVCTELTGDCLLA